MHVGQGTEGGGFEVCCLAAQDCAADVLALGAETCDDDAGRGEELVGGVPDEVDHVAAEEGDAAVDVVFGLPEAGRLPSDLV